MAEAGPEPDPDTDRDHDQKTTNTIGLLDRVKTLLEDFINEILDHPLQYLGSASLIHMRYSCQELKELGGLLINHGNFVKDSFPTEVVLLEQLQPHIYDHLVIIQALEDQNVIPNRTIEIPPHSQQELRRIAKFYQGIDEQLRRLRPHPLRTGHAVPQGSQPSHEETGPQGPRPQQLHDEETGPQGSLPQPPPEQ